MINFSYVALSPDLISRALSDMASSFGTTFTVATLLIVLTLIPAWFLPRRPPATPVEAEEAALVMAH